MIRGRVLIVAGSDSGGGAGIQADIKTATALGAYAMTAVTALTAQDTKGVHAIYPAPADFVRLQIDLALRDIGADVVKTGMLGDAATIGAVVDALMSRPRLVVDPVMVAKGGTDLLPRAAIGALKQRLLPLASMVTPNVPEAEMLTGMPVPDPAAMRDAALALLDLGAASVLLKGGHLPGDTVVDLLATRDGIEAFRAPRIPTRHTHGTGCTLATAIAVGLAQGFSIRDSVIRARAYVRAAIASAPGFGAGHGPLDHTVTVDEALLAALSR